MGLADKSCSGYQAAITSDSEFQKAPFRCPKCGNGHVLMIGRWERAFQKEFVASEDGHPEETGTHMDESYSEKYTHLICHECQIVVEIRSDTVMQLIERNVQLKEKVKELENRVLVFPRGNLTVN